MSSDESSNVHESRGSSPLQRAVRASEKSDVAYRSAKKLGQKPNDSRLASRQLEAEFGSDYAPQTDEDEEDEEYEEDGGSSVGSESRAEDGEIKISPPTQHRNPRPEERALVQQMGRPPPSPLKRAREPDGVREGRSFKRIRGVFTQGYLDLLNADISDAVAQSITHDASDFKPSRIGLSLWTSREKKTFFEALSRLGIDDIPGITGRIKTKSEIEVLQYLKLLHDETKTLKKDRTLEPLEMIEQPAAFELTQTCCNVLEEAADELSLRQETHEELVEKAIWGENWLITPANHLIIRKSAPSNLKSIALFKLGRWLMLSERLFMNSANPEYNWKRVSRKMKPAIRATALEDFRSLVISLARRLISASLNMAESRVRVKSSYLGSKKVVRPRDVKAAAMSLGLKSSRGRFWARCARRLEINVQDGSGNTGELMTYEEVERALLPGDDETSMEDGRDQDGDKEDREQEEEEEQEAEEEEGGSDGEQSDATESELCDDVESESDGASQAENIEGQIEELGVQEEDIQLEVEELFRHSALDFPPTHKPKRAVRAQVTAELSQLAFADKVDGLASVDEEKRLWALLKQEPPQNLATTTAPAAPAKHHRFRLNEFYQAGDDWRNKLEYGPEWEFLYEASKKKNGEGEAKP